MDNNLKNTILRVKYEPGEDLANNIWHKITSRNKRIIFLKFISFSFIGISSLLGLIPMLKILANDFAQSGFYEYASLIFSSNGMLASYWKDFAYSLLESLPTMSIILSLGLVFIFFLSSHVLLIFRLK